MIEAIKAMAGDLSDIDLMSEQTFHSPFAAYDKLREEAPIFFYEPGGFYFVTRYDDVTEALSKPTVFSNEVLDLVGMGPRLRRVVMPAQALLFSDPPAHGQTRSLVDRAFSAPRVKLMEQRIQEILDGLFDAFIDDGEVEIVAQLAMPLPVDFIARELAVPSADRNRFKEWSSALANAFNPAMTTAERENLVPMVEDVNAFMLNKRREKNAAPTEDIISTLATASLSDDEYLTMAQQFVIAGNENTSAAITSAVYRLARQPELYTQLRDDRSLIRPYVEESLRLDSPASGFIRLVKEDTELGGVQLRKGDIVHLRYAAANRDPAKFACPAALDLNRKNIAGHIAFGKGAHVCIGQMLARKEISCVINTLCDRMAGIEVDPNSQIQYEHSFHVRALKALYLQFERAR